MDGKQKILVCGDVKGKFKTFFNRIETINKKSGPFEVLLCVGDFFDTCDNNELNAYKNGFKHISIPTYILGPNTFESSDQYNNLNDGEICTNLTYLGKRGLYTVSSGLKIAYVSGMESCSSEKTDWNFNIDDINAVKITCFSTKASTGEYRGVDVLLTSQWPQKICNDKEYNGSKLLSWLAKEIKPRYHFCGLNNIYYERNPYINLAGNNTQLELSSRFISLATVGNIEKFKYIYAVSIIPVEKMRIIDLIQKTTNDTPCPYDNMDFVGDKQIADNIEPSQYFYDMSTNNNDKKRKHFNKDKLNSKRNRMEFDQDKCWFCLSSPNVEKHLVISIGENFYLALAKGSIDKTHFLILPVTHIQSVSLLSADDWKELNVFKNAVVKYFKSQNKAVTFFERNYLCYHFQINVIAVNTNIEWQIKHTFEDKAEEYNISFDTMPMLTHASQLPNGPYFVAELPDNTTLLTKQMRKFPLHFGREVFCSENLLHCAEKIDWRQCLLPKDEEVQIVKEIRDSFKPFDVTL